MFVERIIIRSDSTNIVFASTGLTRIFKSTDGGITWARSDSGMVPDPNKGVYALTINSQNPQIMYGATRGLGSGAFYKSTDGGKYWSFGGVINDGSTGVIVVDRLHPDTLYAGTSGFGGVFKSVDAGESWNSVLWNLNSVSDMTIDETKPERVYALIRTGQGVARTSDGGINWTITQIGDSSINNPRSLVIEPRNRNEMYVTAGPAQERVLYKSTDYGASWSPMSNGIENLIPFALAIDSTTDQLYLGVEREYSSNGGLYVRSLTTQVGITKPESRFSLAQGYPNPFNSTTIIRYTIPSRQHVSLKVFDVLGREVAILVDQEKQLGEHTAVFDASAVSSGVYFSHIRVGEFVQTKKMVLIR